MRIDVIRAALGVVFECENRRVFPEHAVRYRFDDAAEGQIVVGHHGAWRRRAWPGPLRVIVGDADNRKLRQVAVGYEALKLLQPVVDPLLVGNV